jgi:hypothetical protein
MEKPVSLSVKEWIIRKMAVKMMVHEKVLDTIVSHQFQSANEALLSSKSIEISGFGKFYFNYKKAVKKMERMLLQREALQKKLSNGEADERKRCTIIKKIEGLTEAIEILKPKIDEDKFFTDLRGMEEQADSPVSH